ncbi:hypothetical protein Q8A73_019664 [Channa argus]|nr:hypothetical protein Q8A73_019664 [Channa argus]
MLEKWDTSFKPKVIAEAKHLTSSTELSSLVIAGQQLEDDPGTNLDSDLTSLLLLLHLLPPAAKKAPLMLWTNFIDDPLKRGECQLLILCQETRSLAAFDELFKSHFVFNLSYEDPVAQMFTFVQTSIYNTDIGTTSETPRVCENPGKASQLQIQLYYNDFYVY